VFRIESSFHVDEVATEIFNSDGKMNGNTSVLLTIFLLIKLIFIYLSDGQSTDIQDSIASRQGELEARQKEVGKLNERKLRYLVILNLELGLQTKWSGHFMFSGRISQTERARNEFTMNRKSLTGMV